MVEHRLHQLLCENCGVSTRATLPSDVNPSGYGIRVVALVAVLSGLYRHSTRMVQNAMADPAFLTKFVRNAGLAKTVRTCRKLLKVEPALWLFVEVEGVEPTNNAAQRAIRPAVIWRRTSFGSQTRIGSTFVSRILTVVTSLKFQRRNVLEFMTDAVSAAHNDTPAPSLIPDTTVYEEQVINAA